MFQQVSYRDVTIWGCFFPSPSPTPDASANFVTVGAIAFSMQTERTAQSQTYCTGCECISAGVGGFGVSCLRPRLLFGLFHFLL